MSDPFSSSAIVFVKMLRLIKLVALALICLAVLSLSNLWQFVSIRFSGPAKVGEYFLLNTRLPEGKIRQLFFQLHRIVA
jgi:hypothetical protein